MPNRKLSRSARWLEESLHDIDCASWMSPPRCLPGCICPVFLPLSAAVAEHEIVPWWLREAIGGGASVWNDSAQFSVRLSWRLPKHSAAQRYLCKRRKLWVMSSTMSRTCINVRPLWGVGLFLLCTSCVDPSFVAFPNRLPPFQMFSFHTSDS